MSRLEFAPEGLVFLWHALRCSTKSGGKRLEKRQDLPDEAFFIPSTDHLNAIIRGDKKKRGIHRSFLQMDPCR